MNRPLAVALAAAVYAAAFARPAAACSVPKEDLARMDTRAIQPVAETYAATHPGVCPTMGLLQATKEISGASKITDPWDRPYAIRCAGDEIRAVSFGCDGREGTADDIITPPPENPPPQPAGICPPLPSWPRPDPLVTPGLQIFVHVFGGVSGLLAVAFADHVAWVEVFLG